jgi:hypothetical protein
MFRWYKTINQPKKHVNKNMKYKTSVRRNNKGKDNGTAMPSRHRA